MDEVGYVGADKAVAAPIEMSTQRKSFLIKDARVDGLSLLKK
jgi:hypothetical protein